MGDHGPLFIFLIRLNPFTSSDLFSYAAGLTKMKVFPFALATTLGLLPYAFIPTVFGEYLQGLNSALAGLVLGLAIVVLISILK